MEIIEGPIGISCADIYLRFPEIMEEEFEDLIEYIEDEHINYEGATDVFYDLQQERDKYKSIVEELKKYLKTRYEELEYANEYCIERDGCDNEYNLNRMEAYEEIENKIKELEEGNSND